MPTVDINENIKQMQEKLINLNRESLRLEGAMNMMMDFKKGGLSVIEMPLDPTQEDETPSGTKIEEINTQENPE